MHLRQAGMRVTALLFAFGGLTLCLADDGAEGLPNANVFAQTVSVVQGSSGWDSAFSDRSGDRPLHFVAQYADARGQVHRLEEWRSGQRHLRRRTDDRIDLHADAVIKPEKQPSANSVEYVWNIIDLQKRTVHRISTAGMLHLGMLYSYYAMSHVLTRPAGAFDVQTGRAPMAAEVDSTGPLKASDSVPSFQPPHDVNWWQVRAAGQPTVLVCWAAEYGIPLRTYVQRQGSWRMDFVVESVDTRTISPALFQVSTAGFQVRDVDEIESED